MLLASGLLMLILAAAFAVLLVAVADLRAAARTGAAVATLVFVVLLAAGVMGTAERLVPATQARARSKQAGERLASASSDETRQPGRTPALRVTYDRCSLTVSDNLPAPRHPHAQRTPTRLRGRPGQTLIVTGASGSGKTTLLNAIEAALPGQPGPSRPW